MKKTVWFVVIILFIILILFAILKNKKTGIVQNGISEYIPQEEISDKQNRMTIVTLYFVNPSTNELIPEARGIDVKELMDNPYEKILELLINGSEDPKIGKTIPDGTKINSIKLEGEQLIIDLDEFFISQYEMGSKEQNQMIYSIVNTFLELKEITTVKFLVNGERIEGIEDSFGKLS